MANSILFGMADKLIEKLSSWGAEKLTEKLGSWVAEAWNVKDDAEKLKSTMLTIQAVILDAEEQQGTNRQVEDWLKKLKAAFDDAEDLLDEINTEDLKREVMARDKKAKKARIISSFDPLLFSSKMASRIKETREKLEAISDDRMKFHFNIRTPEPHVVRRKRETCSLIREDEIIGREEEKKQLLKLLLNTNMDLKETVSVVSIVGMGGLGKTALAQLVYNDKEIQQHFELKMWVCVSDDFDIKTIAMKIIGSITNDPMEEVQQKLRKKIEGRKYLLVLDDIWNESRELWCRLMDLLMNGGRGSKIIITTRSKEVAKISGPSSVFLKGLDEMKSWKLFTQKAFENGKEPENQNIIAIGKEIVRKCGGVPLAIRSVGSLMYSKESEREWLSFKDKDLLKIDEQSENRVFQLIKVSYDHIPFYLKKSFSFCSLFPKDYHISRKRLIQLWVAQGFVQSSDDNECLEEVANTYFMDLVQGSFFQDVVSDSVTGNILSCKMHDLMHDLAVSVAGNDCVLINEKEKGKHIEEQIHHLSFGFPLESSVLASFLKAIRLRTFLLPQKSSKSLEESACNQIMSSFGKLRALDLCLIRSCRLPTCIDNMKHLRYLDLSRNGQIEVLPEAITELCNLQTLLLNSCHRLRELPRDTWKLTRLRHLELEGCNELSCMPHGIGQLTDLQTLSLFVLDAPDRAGELSISI